VAENPRIEELRRRVQKDPASIAFAQLAEEYRRAGHYEDAVVICRSGLQTHPSYLSARVTLGHALIEINQLEDAEVELRYVLQHAAENLAAIRAMAEIHHRRGELNGALGYYRSALELARHDPDLEQTVAEISRAVAEAPPQRATTPPAAAPAAPATSDAPIADPPTPVLTPEQLRARFLAETFDLLELDPIEPEPAKPAPVSLPDSVRPQPEDEAGPSEGEHYRLERPEDGSPEGGQYLLGRAPVVVDHPALAGLERFLEVIHSYRERRAV